MPAICLIENKWWKSESDPKDFEESLKEKVEMYMVNIAIHMQIILLYKKGKNPPKSSQIG